MVDLDSDPAKLLEITHIARGMLATRSAVTAFSLAKCIVHFIIFLAVILPACYPGLQRFAVLPVSALPACIISALCCSELFLILLIPLALTGIGARSAQGKLLPAIFALAGLVLPVLCLWAGEALLSNVWLY